MQMTCGRRDTLRFQLQYRVPGILIQLSTVGYELGRVKKHSTDNRAEIHARVARGISDECIRI